MLVKFPYTVEQEEGKFFIQFIDWETGFTEADTKEEIESVAKEMLEGLVEAYKEEGREIPKASSVGSNEFVILSV